MTSGLTGCVANRELSGLPSLETSFISTGFGWLFKRKPAEEAGELTRSDGQFVPTPTTVLLVCLGEHLDDQICRRSARTIA